MRVGQVYFGVQARAEYLGVHVNDQRLPGGRREAVKINITYAADLAKNCGRHLRQRLRCCAVRFDLIHIYAACDVEHVIETVATQVVGVGDADDQHLIGKRRKTNHRVLCAAAKARSQQTAIGAEQGDVGNQQRARQAGCEGFNRYLLPGWRVEGKVIHITIETDFAKEVDGKGNALCNGVVRLDLVAVAPTRAKALERRGTRNL